jgi:poly-gamma-glutamate synthesis protein (capsule biosynthesis protein)
MFDGLDSNAARIARTVPDDSESMQPSQRPRRNAATRPERPSRQRRRWARWAVVAGVAVVVLGAVGWMAAGTWRTGTPAGFVTPMTLQRPTRPARPTFAGTVTVAAVGDMMFGRGVADYMRNAGGAAILSRVATELAAADVALGNLEGPLATTGTRAKGKDVTLLGDPRGVAGLTAAGFDAVGLANNHSLDYGVSALRETMSLLDGAHIAHAGAGMSQKAAYAPATIVTRSGARVAFLSFSHVVPLGFAAEGSHPGIARSRFHMDRVTAAIRSARASHDFVVVAFHWGTEYQDTPSAEQRADGRAAIDAGADLVVGHHPHVIQGVESYKGRLIAYSLGDFVFDHFSRVTGESFILFAQLDRGATPKVSIVPTYLDPTSGRPSIVHGDAAARILTRLRSISAPLHTKVLIAGDRATVEMQARESQ